MKRAAVGLLAGCCFLFLASPAMAQHTIATYAGGGPNGVTAVSAALSSPVAVAVDGSGNVYVVGQASHRVFKVDSSGHLTAFAGNGTQGFGGDGGPAADAQLSGPSGVAVDAAGNVYIVDWQNVRVRRVDALTGVITTIVGDGTNGFSGDGGPAVNATLGGPNGVAVDSVGNVYIADTGNNRIRKIDIGTGVINTVAGVGTAGFSGDGGVATAAELRFPYGVAVDATGNLFIADSSNSRIRRVDVVAGTISTVAGDGGFGFAGDGGLATAARLYAPSGVAVDSSGNLLIADQANRRVRRVDATTGLISTVAGVGTGAPFVFGGDGSPATDASLSYIKGVAVDGAGQIFIADDLFNRIRRVDASGVIDTVAGNGEFAWSGDGDLALRARANFPKGVAVDAGNLFFADLDNQRIRRVDRATGTIETVAGIGTQGFSGDGGPATAAELNDPWGVALDAAGNLYIADRDNNRVRRISAATGIITTVAGTGALGYGGDGGPATSAILNRPIAVALDGAGNLFIADWFNNRVRKVNAATGVITTVAGTGAAGFAGDGGAATSALLRDPTGVAVDAAGNLYIADRVNARVRKVDAVTGIITTAAGDGTQAYAGDGLLATNASMVRPISVAVDAVGQLFITDTDGHNVRKVDAAGFISTVAGTGVGGFSGDGGPATSAQLQMPWGVAVDSTGNVFVVDTFNQRVRVVTNGAPNADAGPDQTVGSGVSFTLSAAASTDPDGDALIYEWRDATNNLVGTGVSVTLSLSEGTYQFTLTASDGSASDTDTVTVTVSQPLAFGVTLFSRELGGGTVNIQPSGTSCTLAPGGSLICYDSFGSGTEVTLTATPAPDSIFLGWGAFGSPSPCTGTGPCTLILTQDTQLSAEFLGPRFVNVGLSSVENGGGTVQIQPTGTSCSVAPGGAGNPCFDLVRSGTEVTLTATPAPDSIFLGWLAGPGPSPCTGTGPCTFVVTEHTGVQASFLGPRFVSVGLVSVDSGGGTVQIQPTGTSCSVAPGGAGNPCFDLVRSGTEVTLTATPAPDSIFLGWLAGPGPSPCTGTGPCTFVVTEHTGVQASFLGPRFVNVGLVSVENGGGTVQIQPTGTSCSVAPGGAGNPCFDLVRSGTQVTLTATPAPDSIFLGWLAGPGPSPCTGTGPCTFVVTEHTGVQASFLGPRFVNVGLVSVDSGGGTVQIQPSGTTCSVSPSGSNFCSDLVRSGTQVTLTATPAPDSIFLGWLAGPGPSPCTGTGPCTFVVTEHTGVQASFLGPRIVSASLVSVDDGAGTVQIQPSGTSCGIAPGESNACFALVRSGTQVTLTATPAPGSTFLGWGGPGSPCSGTAPCTIVVTEHTGATATFQGPRLLAVNLVSTENGGGVVEIQPGGTQCFVAPGIPTPPCGGPFPPGTTVTLTASAAPDSIFVGWSGACSGTGTCTVLMSQNQLVSAEFLGPRLLAVNLTSTENGGGVVSIQPFGPPCAVGPGFPAPPCIGSYQPGTTVTLTASAAPDSIFAGWGGACSGTGTCTVLMSQHQLVSAEFLGPRLLAVNLTSTENGGGVVSIQPFGPPCAVGPGFPAPPCIGSYQPGTTVTLTASAAPDSIFAGWGGACSGTGTCTVLMSQHQLVSAEFLGPRLLAVNLTSTENGGGVVSIQPFGPPCAVGPGFPAPPCIASYQPGTTVTLTALAAPDSIFVGWGGVCSGTGTCTVLMSQHQLVSAEFLGPRLLSVNLTSTDDGGGIVSIQPFGPPCAVGPGIPAPPCIASYQPGTTVTLTALAAPDSIFAGWAGACSGTGICTLLMSQHQLVSATFTRPAGTTPAGSDVPVTPPDQNGAAPVSLTFESVTQAGITSLTTSTPPPGGPAPPSGFGLGDPPTYYDLSTTAVFVGSIEICVSYAGVSFANELDLRLLHFENGNWVDITTRLDTVNDEICGQATSLSPFAVFQAPVAVAIDILPGKFPNTIKLRGHGKVQTAIFSSATFDATTIDSATITLAGASVRTKKKGRVSATVKDVNRDGLPDLVVQIEGDDLDLSMADTVAVLEGATFDGRLVRGSDSVRVVR